MSEKKDPFDYDKIDGSSLADGKTENFELNKIETARYHKFLANHSGCQFDKETKENKFGAIGGHLSISFLHTGLGYFVRCHCNGCKKYADITDYDSI